jgi:hypothetical protein
MPTVKYCKYSDSHVVLSLELSLTLSVPFFTKYTTINSTLTNIHRSLLKSIFYDLFSHGISFAMFSTLNMHRSCTTNAGLLYPIFILFSSICTRKKDLHSSKSNTFHTNSKRNTFNRFSSRQKYLKGKSYQSIGGVLLK